MVSLPDARLPAQSVAPADHSHARAMPDSVDTAAIRDGAVTFAKVDESGFPATTDAEVTTLESTSSTTYTDLTTAGPAVTMTPPASGKVKVHLYANLYHTGGSDTAYMAVALSGGNTAAAANAQAISNAGTLPRRQGATFLFTGLAAASTTFTAKYRAGVGASAQFQDRQIIVEPVLA